MGFICYYWYYY